MFIDIPLTFCIRIKSFAAYDRGSGAAPALADELEFKLKELGIAPDRVEGYRSDSWVVLDYETVVVHIFTSEARSFYDLDRLWLDGEKLNMTFEPN